jgi:osmotically-inducible protein OsmY
MPTHTSAPIQPLTTAVSRALVEDPRTRDGIVEVIDEHGVITLLGTVPTAAAQPGVISVTNSLRVG